MRDGGPLQIVRPGLVDFGPMLDIHDHDRMVMFHVMQKEVAFRMCDRRTRETGRLVKLVVINDFTAMRMSMPPKKVIFLKKLTCSFISSLVGHAKLFRLFKAGREIVSADAPDDSMH